MLGCIKIGFGYMQGCLKAIILYRLPNGRGFKYTGRIEPNHTY